MVGRVSAAYLMPGKRGSTLLIRVEDVVLGLHGDMARVSAVRGAGISSELVGCSFVVEHRVSPSAGFRKSLAVLFHQESLGKGVWHIHDERCLGPLLVLPLDLFIFHAILQRLSFAHTPHLYL